MVRREGVLYVCEACGALYEREVEATMCEARHIIRDVRRDPLYGPGAGRR